MEWLVTPEQLILERAQLLLGIEALMVEPKDEKDCEPVASKELNSKVPEKILNNICRINLFKKRNPRLNTEGF
jgi:hypothetical protein